MPRKKSVKHSAKDFRTAADDITAFLTAVSPNQTDQHVTWLYNYAIIADRLKALAMEIIDIELN